MSNYGAIPSSASPVEHQDPATPPQRPSTRTARARASLSRSVSRSHSRDSFDEGLVVAKSSGDGDGDGDGGVARNVRFASPQRRAGSSSSKRTADGTSNGAPADSALSESHAAHTIRARGVNSDGGRGGDDAGKSEEGPEDVPAWAAGLRKHLNATVVLENSGSVARDHLASERTFLAYVRTSLAIASSGVGESLYCTIICRLAPPGRSFYSSGADEKSCVVAALVQLFTISVTSSSGTRLNSHLQRFARPLGAIVVCMGILLLLVSTSILLHPAFFKFSGGRSRLLCIYTHLIPTQ